MRINLKNIFKLSTALLLSMAMNASAAPASLTYQGRILKADGTPLEYKSVSFIFQIMDPIGSCVIYQEQVDGYDMTNSGGVFDTAIGTGNRNYPVTGVFNILDSLNNSLPLTCQGGSLYTPQITDGRILRVQFYDGAGWKIITPDNIVRSVPYAGYAVSSGKLGNNVATDFILKTGLPTCTAGTFLSWDGTALSCAPVAGASGGTVTNVTATAPLLVSSGSTTPALSITQATTSTNGYLSSADWNTFNSKLGTATAFVGDVSGTYGSTSVDKIKGTAVTITSLASGNFLKYNGTAWVNSSLAIGDVSGLTTQLGNKLDVTNMPASCAANQTLTFSSPSGAWVCSTIAITGTAFGSQSANLVFASPDSASGTATFRALTTNDLPAAISNGLWTVSGSNIYRASGLVGIGTNNPTNQLQVQNDQAAWTGAQVRNDSALNAAQAGLNLKGDTASASLMVNSSGTTASGVTVPNQIQLLTSSTATGGILINARGTGAPLTLATADAPRITILTGGNVGIGTVAPAYALDVVGSVKGNSFNTLSEGALQIWQGVPGSSNVQAKLASTSGVASLTMNASNFSIGTSTNINFNQFNTSSVQKQIAGISTVSTNLAPGTENGGLAFSNMTAGTYGEAMRLVGGNLGIGTATPGYKLDVNGIVNATNFYLNGSPFTAGSASTAVAATGGSTSSITQSATNAATAVRTALTLQNTGTGGANEYLIIGKNAAGTTTFSVNQAGTANLAGDLTASGNVGIGTTAGNSKLTVAGTNVTTSQTTFGNLNVYTTDTQAIDVGGSITLGGNTSGTTGLQPFGSIEGRKSTATSGGTSGYLSFKTSNGSNFPERMRILDTGNVGIGTTAPSANLEIANTITSTGSANMKLNPNGSGSGGSLITLGSLSGGTTVNSVITTSYTGGVEFSAPQGFSFGNTLSNPATGAMMQIAGTTSIGAGYINTAAPTNGLIVQGNVGIGTAVPTTPLSVIGSGGITFGNATANGTASIYNDNYMHLAAENTTNGTIIGSGNGLLLRATANGSNVTALSTSGGVSYINATGGNVGIGTMAPIAALHVLGNSRTQNVAGTPVYQDIITTDSNNAYLRFATGNVSRFVVGVDAADAGKFKVGLTNDFSTTRLAIDSSGNVGVGTTAPSTKMEVVSTSAGALTNALTLTNSDSTTGTEVGLFFNPSTQNSNTRGSKITGFQWGSNQIGLNFYVGYATAAITPAMQITPTGTIYMGGTGMTAGSGANAIMTVSTNGTVGIGTATPAGPLHIYGNSATPVLIERTTALNTNIQYKNTVGSMYAGLAPSGNFGIGNNANLDSSPALAATSGGNVGIGTITPGSKLTVAGPIVSIPSNIATGAAVDLSLSDTFTLASLGTATIALTNFAHGGSYTLVINDTTSRTYTFSGCNTSKFKPANTATTVGTTSIYTILSVYNGTTYDCYITWASGYQ